MKTSTHLHFIVVAFAGLDSILLAERARESERQLGADHAGQELEHNFAPLRAATLVRQEVEAGRF